MYQLLEKTAKETPENLFLVREETTYAQFVANVAKRAATLRKLGIARGDRVGILAHNIPAWPLTAFAIWRLGAVAVLLDTNLTPGEYDNFAKAADCGLVIAEKPFFYDGAAFRFHDIEAPDESDDAAAPADVASTDTATLSFTSGSTGTPKIVPLTHFNLVECSHSLEDMREWFGEGSTLYGFLPLYHVYGFAAQLLAVAAVERVLEAAEPGCHRRG
jgi:fatty-acyl-CoA synthase